MPVAIHTKYIGPSETKGSRVKAYVHRGWSDGRAIVWSVTVPFDHSGDEYERAAQELVRRHWPDKNPAAVSYVGSTADGNGEVYQLD